MRKAHTVPVRLKTRALDKGADLEDVIRGCGFEEVQLLEETVEFTYANEEERWATQWPHGSRATLDRLDPNALERLKQDAFGDYSHNEHPTAMTNAFTFCTVLAKGERPRQVCPRTDASFWGVPTSQSELRARISYRNAVGICR